MNRDLAVDTSALVAIALREPDAVWFIEQVMSADTAVVSAGSLQELSIVLGVIDQGRASVREYTIKLLEALNVTVVPVTGALALLGSAGVLRFRQAPARLNFGDGFAYALAKSRAIPLLCKGNDFPNTDIDVHQPT